MSKSGSANNLSCLAITPGEPAGIGPDIVIRHAQQQHNYPWVVIADKILLQERALQLKLPLHLHEYIPGQHVAVLPQQHLHVWHIPLAAPCQTGVLNPANSLYVLQCLRHAVDACQQSHCHALVTGPVHKAVINDAGINFSGHTEFLAELAECNTVVMMLATPGLRVALATTHLPLSQVSSAITAVRLETVLTILHDDLQSRFSLAQPRITVCGLNPHAGEAGHLGHEEIDVIIPVLQRLRQRGYDLRGPLPADTAFLPPVMQQTDAFLAMYHDQGLPVLKYAGFGKAANITLGLPFVRTSVDHGTALDLAGTGQADASSLSYAIEVAQQMCRTANRQLHSA